MLTPDRHHDFNRGEQRLAAEIALAVQRGEEIPDDVREHGAVMLLMLAKKP